MMYKSTFLSLALLILSIFAIGQSSVIYYQSSKAEIANPERGWYDDYYSHYGGSSLGTNYISINQDDLVKYRERDNITLILRLFYLHEFLEENNVSSDYLNLMQADFDAIRAAGVKCIIRFAYSASQDAEIWDATPEKVFSHIASLSNILKDNSDIIAGVQAGFIGAWGEWYYTENFADASYQPDETDQINRRLLVEKLLDALPEHISVQSRTPAIMKNIVQTEDPISESEAFDGSYKSRVGHHNDCFLANRTDYGTYVNVDADIAYLHESTKYTITGGETCDPSNEYSDCENSLERVDTLHWTYLNRDYNTQVYKKWKDQGCYEEINISLGYRIALEKVTIYDSVNAGSSLNISFVFRNEGYAAPISYKPIQIVLTNTESESKYIFSYQGTNDDIRFWLPGQILVDGQVTIPDTMPDGNYTVGIKFPDQDSVLAKNVAYSIQLANVGVWDSISGTNMLNHIVSVGVGGIGELPPTPSDFAATTFSETDINLSWTNNSENVSSFEIMRSTENDDNWTLITEPDNGTLQYNDESLQRATIYNYIIRSKNLYGYSDWSNIASAKTQGETNIKNTKMEMLVYPNPLKGSDLSIHFNDQSERQIIVHNITGQSILNTKTNLKEYTIERSLFKRGIYILSIKENTKISSTKLIVY